MARNGREKISLACIIIIIIVVVDNNFSSLSLWCVGSFFFTRTFSFISSPPRRLLSVRGGASSDYAENSEKVHENFLAAFLFTACCLFAQRETFIFLITK